MTRRVNLIRIVIGVSVMIGLLAAIYMAGYKICVQPLGTCPRKANSFQRVLVIEFQDIPSHRFLYVVYAPLIERLHGEVEWTREY